MVQVADLVASLTAVDTGFAASMFLAEERVKGLHGSTDNALGGIAKLGVGLGLLSGAVLVDAIKQASNYDTMLVHIQSNTGMTDAETKAMSQGIQQLAASTGAPLDQLAQGFMHIHNFGFSAAEAMAILKPAMESALSTGDDVGQVASALGVAMHEFHLNASQATVAMNLLHIAAQEGNATLGQFVDGTTQAFNLAGGFGVKIEDVAAALSTLTQSGQTARMASNGLSSVMAGIVKPTQAAQNAILEISKATHVDLTNAFSATGLKSIGLTGILMRVHDALGKLGPQAQDQVKNMMTYADQLEKTHVSNATFDKDMANYAKNTGGATQALLALFPNIRAFREAMLLTGSQFTSWQTHITDMHATIEGQTNPTLKGFADYMKLPSTMLAIMGENIHILMIALGESLMPAVKQLLEALIPMVQVFADWAKGHTQIVAGVLGIGVALGILSAAVLAFQVVAAPLLSIAAPLIAIGAAAALLYEAWTHNFGGIQQKTEQVYTAIYPLINGIRDAFNVLTLAFSEGGFTEVFKILPTVLDTVRLQFMTVLGNLGELLDRTGLKQTYFWQTAVIVWDRFASALLNVWNTIHPIFDNIGNGLDGLRRAFQQGGFSGLFTKVLSDLAGLGAQISSAFSRIDWGASLRSLEQGIRMVFDRWGHWLDATAIPQLHKWIDPLVEQFKKIDWTKVIASLEQGARFVFDRWGNWLDTTAIPQLHKWLDPIVDQVKKIDWGRTAASMEQGIRMVFDRWGNWLDTTGIPQLHRWLDPIVDQVKKIDWGRSATSMEQGIRMVFDRWGNWLDTTGVPQLHKYLDPIVENFKKIDWSKAVASMEQGGRMVFDRWGNWLDTTGIPQLHKWLDPTANKIGAALSKLDFVKMGNDLGTAVGNALGQLGNWIDGKANTELKKEGGDIVKGIIAGVSSIDLSTKMEKAMQDLFKGSEKWLYNIGAGILGGLTGGMKSKYNDFTSFLGGIVSFIPNTLHAGLKSHSPSLVMHDIGIDIMQGLINGMVSKHTDLSTLLQTTSAMISGGIHSGYTGTGAIGAGGSLIVVNVAAGAITTSGTAAHSGLSGDRVGRVVADALETLILAQRTTAPRARASLPGATRGA